MEAMRRGVVLLFLAVFWGSLNPACGDTIRFGGVITQPTANEAFINSSLNAIALNDAYSVYLDFNGSITSTGTYTAFTGVTFSDPTAAAGESGFDLGKVSLTISNDASNSSYYDLTLLGCLVTGTACDQGNQLAANFEILAADLNVASASAQPSPFLTPMDLLEDDGATDIHGSVTHYSYTMSAGTVPEPSSGWELMLPAMFGIGAFWRRKRSQMREQGRVSARN